MARTSKPKSANGKSQGWPADKVEKWPIERLLNYPQNPRLHPESSVEKLMASIRQFGWTMPVLVDEAGVLIAGHGRIMAAKRLEMAHVPVMVAKKWTEEQKRAYRIADNKLPMDSIWDPDMLEIELASLRAVKFDLEPLGLESIELPEMEDVPTAPPPRANRTKTTIFLSVKNADAEKARKTVAAALTKARIEHNL